MLWKILGINDDQSTCDLCGKSELKRVVWLENTETQEVMALGTTCAAKMQKITVKVQKANEKDFFKEQKANIREEIKPYVREYQSVIDNAPDNIGSIESYRARIAHIRNHPNTIKYKTKCEEIAKSFGVTIDKVAYA